MQQIMILIPRKSSECNIISTFREVNSSRIMWRMSGVEPDFPTLARNILGLGIHRKWWVREATTHNVNSKYIPSRINKNINK